MEVASSSTPSGVGCPVCENNESFRIKLLEDFLHQYFTDIYDAFVRERGRECSNCKKKVTPEELPTLGRVTNRKTDNAPASSYQNGGVGSVSTPAIRKRQGTRSTPTNFATTIADVPTIRSVTLPSKTTENGVRKSLVAQEMASQSSQSSMLRQALSSSRSSSNGRVSTTNPDVGQESVLNNSRSLSISALENGEVDLDSDPEPDLNSPSFLKEIKIREPDSVMSGGEGRSMGNVSPAEVIDLSSDDEPETAPIPPKITNRSATKPAPAPKVIPEPATEAKAEEMSPAPSSSGSSTVPDPEDCDSLIAELGSSDEDKQNDSTASTVSVDEEVVVIRGEKEAIPVPEEKLSSSDTPPPPTLESPPKLPSTTAPLEPSTSPTAEMPVLASCLVEPEATKSAEQQTLQPPDLEDDVSTEVEFPDEAPASALTSEVDSGPPTPTAAVAPAPITTSTAPSTSSPAEVPNVTSTPPPPEVPIVTSTPPPPEVSIATSAPPPPEVPTAAQPQPAPSPLPTEDARVPTPSSSGAPSVTPEKSPTELPSTSGLSTQEPITPKRSGRPRKNCFYCPTCQKSFDSQEKLHHHQVDHINDPDFDFDIPMDKEESSVEQRPPKRKRGRPPKNRSSTGTPLLNSSFNGTSEPVAGPSHSLNKSLSISLERLNIRAPRTQSESSSDEEKSVQENLTLRRRRRKRARQSAQTDAESADDTSLPVTSAPANNADSSVLQKKKYKTRHVQCDICGKWISEGYLPKHKETKQCKPKGSLTADEGDTADESQAEDYLNSSQTERIYKNPHVICNLCGKSVCERYLTRHQVKGCKAIGSKTDAEDTADESQVEVDAEAQPKPKRRRRQRSNVKLTSCKYCNTGMPASHLRKHMVEECELAKAEIDEGAKLDYTSQLEEEEDEEDGLATEVEEEGYSIVEPGVVNCNICNVTMGAGSYRRHCRTKRHLKQSSSQQEAESFEDTSYLGEDERTMDPSEFQRIRGRQSETQNDAASEVPKLAPVRQRNKVVPFDQLLTSVVGTGESGNEIAAGTHCPYADCELPIGTTLAEFNDHMEIHRQYNGNGNGIECDDPECSLVFTSSLGMFSHSTLHCVK